MWVSCVCTKADEMSRSGRQSECIRTPNSQALGLGLLGLTSSVFTVDTLGYAAPHYELLQPLCRMLFARRQSTVKRNKTAGDRSIPCAFGPQFFGMVKMAIGNPRFAMLIAVLHIILKAKDVVRWIVGPLQR